MRDEDLLESALARPRNLYLYEGVTDSARLAAAYAFGLTRNHPFMDGNKRAALMSIGLFLERNGHHLRADKVATTRMMFAVAAGEIREEELAAWIRENMSGD